MKKNVFWLGLALCAGFVMTSCDDDDNQGNGGVTDLADDQPAAMVTPQGFYVVNEGWFGHDKGSVNYYSNTTTDIKYRLFKEANSDAELGVTTTYAAMWGNRMFIVSKQGNRLVVTDKNFKKLAVFTDELGGDGSMFLGVNDKKGYVSTTKGIMIFDLEGLKLTGAVEGVSAFVGNMCRAEGKVFAVSAGKLFIIDATTDRVLKTVDGTFLSVVLSKDGSVWVATETGLQKYDADDMELEGEEIKFQAGTEMYDSWVAWNANSLCASTQENVLYWMTGEKSMFSVTLKKIVKYDIDRNQFSTIKELGMSEDNVTMAYYGAGIRVNPITDELVTMATKFDWGIPDAYSYCWVYKLDADGKDLLAYELFGGDGTSGADLQKRHYWYPALPFFDDANQPQILLNQVKVKAGKTVEVDLEEKVVDYDNIFASMMFELTPTDGSVAEVALDGDDLKVIAGALPGVTACKLAVISNGVRVEKNIQIVVE